MLDFTPSLKKIGRAEAKLAYIRSIVDRYISDQPYDIRSELHGGMHHLIARRNISLPDAVAWEAIEAVIHLRSALDKMLVATVEANGRGTSGITFPFGGSGNGRTDPFPRESIRLSLGKKITAEQFQFVLDQRPYYGGNNELWLINEIANEDKHRKNLVATVPRLNTEQLTLSGGHFVGGKYGVLLGSDEYNYVLGAPDKETILISFSDGPRQPKISGYIAITVTYEGTSSAQGKEVAALLSEQITLVKIFIQEFQNRFG